MKVVVTGASGFLGRVLLAELGHRGVDGIGVSRRPLQGLVQVDNYAYAPSGDVLVHLAEVNDRRLAAELGAPYEAEAARTISALLGKRYERVVYASSAALYGDQAEAPRAVGDPVYATDPYTRLKLWAEGEVLRGGGVVARLANLYGPGLPEASVMGTILRQLGTQGPVRVYDTSPVRDFLWAEDAAAALAQMCVGPATGVFNVGTGKGTSILELTRCLLTAAGQDERPIAAARADGPPSRLVVDIRETTRAFDWQPTVPLQLGIETLIKTRKLAGTT